ncbi:MAG: DegT/DnrJ/EryC1/StrS family aminotransferase [Rhodospirillaceae bacterium]
MLVKPFYLDLDDAEISILQRQFGDILRGGTLILGPYTEAFEAAFARYVGTEHAISVNSGTAALEILLRLKGVSGRTVAVPTNTNFASVAAIIHAGGSPAYMDMRADTFCSDLLALEAAHRRHPELAGAVWVHIGGIITPDFPAVVAYCQRHGIFLIEDAAHAHGSRLAGIKAGAFADGAAFSFFPTKVMTTMEGGMITTNSAEEAELARSFRNQGKRGAKFGGLHHDMGNSWRLSEIAACIGLVMLDKLDTMIARRARAAQAMIAALDAIGIRCCRADHMDQASWYKLIVSTDNLADPDELVRRFAADGVILGGGVYHLPCHRQPVFKYVAWREDEVAVAEYHCGRHICPPLTSGMTEAEIHATVSALRKHLQ